MSAPVELFFSDAILDRARDMIRAAGGDVVFVGEVIEQLAGEFADDVQVTSDVVKVLNLVEMLWDHTNIHRVNDEFIGFCWMGDVDKPDPHHGDK